MNVDDRDRLDQLKVEISKDIALAISSFKVWLLATILSNVILIGIPALFVFFSTQYVSSSAFNMSAENKRRIDRQAETGIKIDNRVGRIEDFLADKYKYRKPTDAESMP